MSNVIQLEKYKNNKKEVESVIEEVQPENKIEPISNEIFQSIVDIMEDYDCFFPYDESFNDLVLVQESINSYLLRLNNEYHALQDIVDDIVIVENDNT